MTSDCARPPSLDDQKLPIKMLNDRVLVRIPEKDGERRSTGGILIPATAQISKRLVWAEVVALGQNVRTAEVGDRVLFSPEDRYEVEVGGTDYIMLRERDIHAVAATPHRSAHRPLPLAHTGADSQRVRRGRLVAWRPCPTPSPSTPPPSNWPP